MNVWGFLNDVLVTQHTNTDLSGSYCVENTPGEGTQIFKTGSLLLCYYYIIAWMARQVRRHEL